MTDEKTPGDGTHELRLPERSGAGGSTPSTPEPASPPKTADGFTWGLRPRGPDRTSAPPTAAIVLPSFVQPELPTNNAATNDAAQNDATQNGSAQGGPTRNGDAPAGAGAGSAVPAGPRRAPASSRRARVTEPTEPPPLVEPPRVKRTVSAAELATQAMSLEEILAAQEAGPITRETWSRPIPTQTGRAAVDHAEPHSRRSHLPQTHASAEAEAAAITSLPAIAPGTGAAPAGATAARDASAGGAPVASTTSAVTGGVATGGAAGAASSTADAELSTQALSAQDVREAEAPRYRPRRAHLPEGVHDRNPAPADVVVAPTFRQAETAHALPQLPPTRGAANTGIKRSAVSPGMPHGQKVLLWIAGSLVMVLVLVAVYLLSSRLGEQSVADNQGAGEAVDADPTPVLTGDIVPADPGVQDWTALAGGECLTGFESPWAEEFTVVDCAEEHSAQVLTRAELSAGPDAPFPGAETLTTDVGVLCGLPAVLNYGQAAAVNDIQVSSSHPVDAADWSTGDRTYFCFVDRVSGEPLPADLRVVPAS